MVDNPLLSSIGVVSVRRIEPQPARKLATVESVSIFNRTEILEGLTPRLAMRRFVWYVWCC